MNQQLSDMNNIRVRRDTLLEVLGENRNEHRETFLEAQKNYRQRVIEELDTMLEDARENRPIRRIVNLLEPEDHTGDYDAAIAMLEMCVDQELIISSHDFQRLVMDEWGWKKAWAENTVAYTSKRL